MTRISLLLLLSIIWTGPAFAVVYQCRDKAGNIFLTNDRSKFPPGCEQFGEPFGEQPAPPPAVTAPAARQSEPQVQDRRRPPAPPRPQPTAAPVQEPQPAIPAAATPPPDASPMDPAQLNAGQAAEQPAPPTEEEEEEE